jgi:hypothetical protein
VGGSSSGTGGRRGVAMPADGGVAAGGAGEPEGEGGAGGAGGATSSLDYYVDPLAGDDLNPGSELLPFKTIEHAASLAIDGDSIWLEDGWYDWMTQPAFRDDVTITFAHGVALRAIRPGFVQLFSKVDVFGQGGLAFEGDAELTGLHLVGFNPALRADHGRLELHAVSFESPWDEGICHSGEHALVMLSGTAKMSMDDAGGEAVAGTNAKCVVRLDDEAELTVQGGQISSGGWEASQYDSAIFGAWGHSKLRLDGVAVRGSVLTVLGAWGSSSVSVAHSSIQGGAVELGRAPALMTVADDASLTIESSWFDGADLQCCLYAPNMYDHPPPAGKVVMNDVTMSHCRGAVALSSDSEVRLENVSLSDNAGAVFVRGGGGGGSLEIHNGRIASNELHGIEIDPGSGDYSFSMRDSSVMRNGGDGIRIGHNPGAGGALSLDLGTLDDPGANFLGGNGRSLAGSVNLRIMDGAEILLFAVGNFWDSSTQGSDSGGGYYPNHVDSLIYDADHELVGTNYAFEGANTASIVLRLAQQR